MAYLAAQFRPVKGDWDVSAARLEALLASAPVEPGSLIVCPEMALTGYVFEDVEAAAAVAEPADSRTFEFAARCARRYASYVVIGYPEADGETLYNSALIVGPDGSLLANYRKRLLYDQDETWATPGDTPYPLIETPFGLLACGICMDLNDDEFIDFLFDAQPDVVAFPTNWLEQGFDVRSYWRWRLQGYPCWFVAANTYGVEEGIAFRGRSAILDPRGRAHVTAPASGDVLLSSSVP